MLSPRERYVRTQLDETFRLWLGKAALIGAALIMLPLWMDLAFHRGQLRVLLLYRVLIAAILLLGYFFVRRRLFANLAPFLAVVWVATCAILLEHSLALVALPGTQYVIGNLVFLVVVTGFTPARFKYVSILAAIVYGIFLIPLLTGSINLHELKFAVMNTYVLMILVSMLVLRFIRERDVVHELEMKYDLSEYRNNLESTVAERTAELARANEQLQREFAEHKRTEEQLRHSQKMDAVGRLAGGVAHDFNNILTAIIGYGSLLQVNLRDDDPMRPYCDELLVSAQRAAGLTQSLLTFSRKHVIHLEPVDLHAVIDSFGKLLRRIIGEDVSLVLERVKENLIVVADGAQLEQMLMNLATNARDAMPRGGQLTIETGRIDVDEDSIVDQNEMKKGAYAVIAVSDTGAGMDEETVSKIFEPFFTTKENGRGTGLGLSIVHGIARQHGGYVSVHSKLGQGSTFKLYLPLHDVGSPKVARLQTAAHETARGTETVLLAEDDVMIRRLVRTVLQDAGYRVIEAVDGVDAIEKVRQYRDEIQLLLLDVIMPKKNGREVYDEAKSLAPGAKTIFMSGYAADVVGGREFSLDEQELISKPVSPGELLRRIRAVIDAS